MARARARLLAEERGVNLSFAEMESSHAPTLPPRLRRMLELVYGVEGVTAARVWHWPGRVAVGVRPAVTSAPTELLRRVEVAVAGLREPDETWDFGLLDGE